MTLIILSEGGEGDRELDKKICEDCTVKSNFTISTSCHEMNKIDIQISQVNCINNTYKENLILFFCISGTFQEAGMGKAFRFPRNSVFHFPFSAEKIRKGKLCTRNRNGTENRLKKLTRKKCGTKNQNPKLDCS